MYIYIYTYIYTVTQFSNFYSNKKICNIFKENPEDSVKVRQMTYMQVSEIGNFRVKKNERNIKEESDDYCFPLFFLTRNKDLQEDSQIKRITDTAASLFAYIFFKFPY